MPMVTRLRLKKGVGKEKEPSIVVPLLSSARTDGTPSGRRAPKSRTAARKKGVGNENVVNSQAAAVKKEVVGENDDVKSQTATAKEEVVNEKGADGQPAAAKIGVVVVDTNVVKSQAAAAKKRIVKENVPKPQIAVKTETTLAPPVGKKANTTIRPRTKFPDRLLWKTEYSGIPTTSTPKREPRSQKVTKYDIDTAFGFDDSVDSSAEYSTLLSPIAHASPNPKDLVWKIHPLSQRNVECGAPATCTKPLELPIPLTKDDAVKPTTTRKRVHYTEERDPETEYDFIPQPKPMMKQYGPATKKVATKPRTQKRVQKPKKTNSDKHCEEDLDEDARRWLEEKNKEFEEVLKTRLVIEHSFSD